MTFSTTPWPWRRWLLACLLLCAGLGLGLGLPGAARANVVCSVGNTSADFGNVTVSNANGALVSGTVGYSCISYNDGPTTVSLCLDLGNPSYPGVPGQPAMQKGQDRLNFQLYLDPALSRLWGKTVAPLQTQFTLPGRNSTLTGNFTYYGLIQGNQASAPAGTYTAAFYNTTLGFMPSGSASCQANINGFSAYDFSLNLSANVINGCTVSASAINLGTVSRTTGSAAAGGTIVVNCPNQTAYTVGLLPSNGDMSGAGLMSGTGTNTDKVPYQLRSGSVTGSIWGNTATSTSTGNGVAGTGNGSNQSLPVYATVNNTNFNADTYKDTVRVFVNY